MLVVPGFVITDPVLETRGGIPYMGILFSYSYYANKQYSTQFINIDFWGDVAERLSRLHQFKKGLYCIISASNVYVNSKDKNNYLKGCGENVKLIYSKTESTSMQNTQNKQTDYYDNRYYNRYSQF